MRLRVTGVVQGVGYRPFVHRLATSLGLHGDVRNDTAGVVITAFGDAGALDEFCARLRTDAPPLAVVESVVIEDDSGQPIAEVGFHIVASDGAMLGAVTALPPDIAVCADCLSDMRDPHDRRYRYPFVTCTNCGPRFTITSRLPYDRPNTTMATFALCPACQAEYDDPTDRRFHAQPLACPVCGPRLTLTRADGDVVARDDRALRDAQRMIDAGAIVAVKGLGGYHLVCDATNPDAVRTLRARKHRGDKPFAVLVAQASIVEPHVSVSATEAAALASPQRPIVLLRRVGGERRRWPEAVAPGAADLGVMLPATPVQHLLLDGLATPVVVCTSGNVADEPIVTDDDEALARLAGLADAWLTNDRPIHTACDDSVVRARGRTVVPLRRARGFTPLPVHVAGDGPSVLAMGGDLKGALCVLTGEQAFMSQHLGDHGELATYRAASAAARQLLDLLQARPDAVAVDAHPAYLSARLGRELAAEWGVPVVEVQHHHAHLIAVAAEHGVTGTVLGVAYDGTGYGTDGAIWGGEILRASASGFERVGHLGAVPLPGGDAAIEHPARTALAHLWAAGVEWDERIPSVAAVPEADRAVLRAQLAREVSIVPTTSAGRLFDAVASLAGVRHRVAYEAQAAIELEAIAAPGEHGAYAFPTADVSGPDGCGVVECAPVIRAIAADAVAGVPAPIISARFHSAFVSHVHHEVSRSACDTNAGEWVVLGGGVFQNALLADACEAVLVRDGFRVLTNRLVPTNDGGLALGQAMIARAALTGAR